ncbi:MAG: potassium transporter [Spirochaetes bacterium]|nr:potassium transporter [Spirochaetota bacterium]MBU1080376.1 potassium transporter [Spirochaetota bacterium]
MKFRVSADKVTIFTYFLIIISIGSLLLSLPAAWSGLGSITYLDAIFTSTSAVCVTGLIVVDTALFSAFGKTVIMLLIQLGGLGIVAFATIYVAAPRRKVSLLNRGIIKEMYIDEVESNPVNIIRHIVLTTIAIEFLGFLIIRSRFKAAGIPQYNFAAAFHAVSAFCNAGFSTFSDSLESFAGDWRINLAFIGLIVSGGLGFVVLQDIGRVFMRTKRRFSYHTRIVVSVSAVLILAGAACFYALERGGAFSSMSIPERLLASLFQSVTTRTAGFDTVAQSAFGFPAMLLAVFLMFTGGSPGSTAGGVKTTTIFMAFAAAFKGHEDDGSIMYKGGALSSIIISKAFSIIVKAVIIITASLLLVLCLEGDGASFPDLFFEVVSAFGTVGLSRGATAGLGGASKVVIIMTMFIGRVGLFAMAITKSSDRIERFADYPRENLLLG